MLLAIDVGNTQTHIGMFRDEELVEHWRFATSRTTTSDELAIRLAALMRLRGLTLDDVDGAIVASVVPQQDQEWDAVNERYFHGRMLMVEPGIKLGMPVRTDNPREVGADRLMNAAAPVSSSTSGRASTTTSSPPTASTWAARSRRACRSRWTRSPSVPPGS